MLDVVFVFAAAVGMILFGEWHGTALFVEHVGVKDLASGRRSGRRERGRGRSEAIRLEAQELCDTSREFLPASYSEAYGQQYG